MVVDRFSKMIHFVDRFSKALFVCLKVVFFWKVNSGKVNYFLMFGSLMKNKLENTSIFGYVMENELKNNILMFYFFQVY